MSTLSPTQVATLTGLISGLLLSIPVGPVNLTIINEGARRGFRWAALIGLGATVMEVIYCSLAFTGFASFFSHGMVKSAMELFSFAFMLYLGLKFIQVRTIPSTTKMEVRVEEKLHPHSAFMVGFVRVLGNPGVFVFWIILAANFLSRGWVHPNWPGKLACIAGVAGGCAAWFLALSYAVSLGHRKLSEKTLLRMEHLSGICLLVLALVHGINILYQTGRNKPAPHEKPGLIRLISHAQEPRTSETQTLNPKSEPNSNQRIRNNRVLVPFEFRRKNHGALRAWKPPVPSVFSSPEARPRSGPNSPESSPFLHSNLFRISDFVLGQKT